MSMTQARPLWQASDAVLAVPILVSVTCLFALAAEWPLLGVVALLGAGAVAPALMRHDLADHRLPNVMTMPLVVLGFIAALGELVEGAFGAAATGAGVVVVLLLLGATAGLGMGDVKLGGALALSLTPCGWWVPIAALALAFVLGGIVGIASLARGIRDVPFGPWLIAGAGLALAAWAMT